MHQGEFMPFHKLSAFGLTFTASLASALPAMAEESSQDASATQSLPNVVVTAPPAPAVPQTVTAADIEAVQATTMRDIFRNTPDVVVSGGGTDTIQKFYVHGIEDQNLNVSIDGARQNGTLYRHQASKSYTDPDLLKKVEVDAGTGGALAGPGALGGAVRFTTKDAEDLLLPGQSIGATEKLTYFSNGDGFRNSLSIYGKPLEKIDFVLSLSKQWADDYKGGNGVDVPYSQNEPLNGLAKVKLALSDDQTLKLGYDHRVDKGVRRGRPNLGTDEDIDSVASRKMERRAYTLNYAYTPEDDPYVDLTFDLNRSKRVLTRGPELLKPLFGSADTDTKQARWWTSGYDLRNRSRLDELTLTYGTDYTWDKSEGVNKTTGEHHSENAETLGLYAQADYAFTEKWSAYAGLRFDHATLNDYYDNVFTDDHLSPSIGTAYKPIPGLTLFGERNEASRGILPVGGFTLLNGPDTTNYTTHAEGGVATTWQGGAKVEWNRWNGDLTLFTTKIRHYSNSGGAQGKPFYRSNDGKIVSKGFTAGVGYTEAKWDARVNYTHYDLTVGNGDATSMSFNYGSPQGDRLSFAFNYRIPAYDLSFGWNSSFVHDVDVTSDGDTASIPGYDVHDFTVTWQPSANYSVSLAALNVFDERYINQSTPYTIVGKGPVYSKSSYDTVLYDPGRDIRLTLSAKF